MQAIFLHADGWGPMALTMRHTLDDEHIACQASLPGRAVSKSRLAVRDLTSMESLGILKTAYTKTLRWFRMVS